MKNNLEREYNEKFHSMFGYSNIPCYFIDSYYNRPDRFNEYIYNQELRNIYNARLQNFSGVLLSMKKVSVRNIKVEDVRFEKMEKERKTEEINRVTTPIYTQHEVRNSGMSGWISIGGSGYHMETRHSGNKTTITYCEKEREKNTLYNGQVTYGEWKVIRSWTQ